MRARRLVLSEDNPYFVNGGRRKLSILFADEQTKHHHAAAYRQLHVQGTPIPTNDLWIAALVLQHNLRLHDRDRHFDHLPRIVRV